MDSTIIIMHYNAFNNNYASRIQTLGIEILYFNSYYFEMENNGYQGMAL